MHAQDLVIGDDEGVEKAVQRLIYNGTLMPAEVEVLIAMPSKTQAVIGWCARKDAVSRVALSPAVRASDCAMCRRACIAARVSSVQCDACGETVRLVRVRVGLRHSRCGRIAAFFEAAMNPQSGLAVASRFPRNADNGRYTL
jgi:hypothetical protein